tara:strand:- start:2477 stop:2812 length:336 start_codon:yes stop_codon:yes gene_type:complete
MSILKIITSKINIVKNLNLSKRFLTNLAINYSNYDYDFDQYFETEIKYNKQYKFFYEKKVPIAATMSLCPICKGSGWITKKNFNLNIKTNKQTNSQFKYELCNQCNGNGTI